MTGGRSEAVRNGDDRTGPGPADDDRGSDARGSGGRRADGESGGEGGGARLRLAVMEAHPELRPGGRAWRTLAGRVRAAAPDLVLLGEMPFGPWIAADPDPDPEAFEASLRLHGAGIDGLSDLGAPAVAGTRPAREGDRPVNQAFLWSPAEGARPVHTKQCFPDEPGYHEARWFRRGRPGFRTSPLPPPDREEAGRPGGSLRTGFLICTEVWFNERARRYGREGADLILVPRVTPPGSTERWKTAVRMAALVSGCYAASSNRRGRDGRGERFGGTGWVFGPDGDLLAETSAEEPVAVADLDPSRVQRAKRTYPRYVAEPPEIRRT